jgi:hypothetical protein
MGQVVEWEIKAPDCSDVLSPSLHMSNNEPNKLAKVTVEDSSVDFEVIAEKITLLHLRMAWHSSKMVYHRDGSFVSLFKSPSQKWHFHDKLHRVYLKLTNAYEMILFSEWVAHNGISMIERVAELDSTFNKIESASKSAAESSLWTFDALALLDSLL